MLTANSACPEGSIPGRQLRALLVLACFAAYLACWPQSAYAHARAEETHVRVTWSGAWADVTDPGSSGGAQRSSLATGAAVIVAFEGTSFTWIGSASPSSGSAAIALDGKDAGVVNAATAVPAGSQARIWHVSGLRRAHHQVTITALASADASGTGSISADAFETDGAIVRVLRRTPFTYPWRTYIVIDKSSYRLYWVKDRWLVKSYKIAHGRKWGYTPAAVWRIDQKYKTDPRGVYGPRKMRLFRRVKTSRGYRFVHTRYGVHGTNQPWVIGTMASHGCIRMYNRDVLELWPQVPLGTMVVTRS